MESWPSYFDKWQRQGKEFIENVLPFVGKKRKDAYVYMYFGICINDLWKSIRNSHMVASRERTKMIEGSEWKRDISLFTLWCFLYLEPHELPKKKKQIKLKKKKKKDRKTWLIVIYTNGSLFFSHKKEPKVSAYCWFNGSVMPNEPGSFFSSRTSVLRGLAFYLHGCFFMLLRWLHSSGIRRKDKENQKLFPNDAFWPGNKTSLYMSWARNGS